MKNRLQMTTADLQKAKEREKKRIEKLIARIEKCNGNCMDCAHCEIKIADIDEHHMAYAFNCRLAVGFQILSENLHTLKAETLEALRFEAEHPWVDGGR